MKNLSKKLLLVAGLLASVSLFATDMQQEKDYDQGHGVQEHQMMGAFSAPARFDVKGSLDLFITASYLYWQPIQESMSLAYDQYPAPTTTRGKVYDMDFDFKSGFKVGMGINLSYDNWNLYLEYLRLHSTHKEGINLPTNATLNCLWRDDTGPLSCNSISSSWEFDTDLLDFYMTRPYYLGTKLTLKPFAGLRGGWIDQKLNVRAIDTSDYPNRTWIDSDSWLVGPRGGVDCFWHLGEGFRVFTNIAASLFYQHFKTTLKYYTINTNTLDYYQREKIGRVVPNIDLALGLAWGTYFADNDWHIDLSAGYEFHHFWNQNTLRPVYEAIVNGIIVSPGDLMLQGLTVTARLDF